MFTPTAPRPASSATYCATSSGSSEKPASMSAVTAIPAPVMRRTSSRVSTAIAPVPSRWPASNATPRLVVPTTTRPDACNQRADARSHAFGSRIGDPGRCMLRNSAGVSMCDSFCGMGVSAVAGIAPGAEHVDDRTRDRQGMVRCRTSTGSSTERQVGAAEPEHQELDRRARPGESRQPVRRARGSNEAALRSSAASRRRSRAGASHRR